MNWYKKALALPLEQELAEKGKLDYENIEEYWEGVILVNEDLTKKDAKYLEKKYPNIKPLGSGHEGIAYDIGNNKVLKLTFNTSEYNLAKFLIKNPLCFFTNVYSAEKLNKTYAIVIEKCKEISHKERMEFDIKNSPTYNKIKYLLKNIQKLFSSFRVGDISDDNVGIDKNGNLVVIDLGVLQK